MGTLQDVLSEHGADWIRKLVAQTDMGQGQAETFLPVAAKAVNALLEGGELDLSSLLGGGGLDDLLEKLDLGALAGAADVDRGTAARGLETIGPELLGALSGGGQAGELLGAAGGLAKKLFG